MAETRTTPAEAIQQPAATSHRLHHSNANNLNIAGFWWPPFSLWMAPPSSLLSALLSLISQWP